MGALGALAVGGLAVGVATLGAPVAAVTLGVGLLAADRHRLTKSGSSTDLDPHTRN
jgi:hypothetical protein